jgi:4,5-dihydroxyphthalate decarboxylase
VKRRDVLKAGALGTLGTMIVPLYVQAAEKKLSLKSSGYPFEHLKPLLTGKVQVEGANVEFVPGQIGNINTQVFTGTGDLDFTEIGLIPFILATANDGFDAYRLLPVFPLRMFRHKSIFVHADAGIQSPADLKGRRIGTPGYSSTSLTWIRGLLQDEYGVSPKDVQWVLAAADSSASVSGKTSAQEQVVPEGVSITTGPAGKDESDLLLDRDVDALFHAAEPRAFVERHPKVLRLFPDVRQAERDYYARTGIFPIMHSVAIRNDLVETHPWLPSAVFDAYAKSKAVAYADMSQKWFLRTIPWFAQELESTRELMGENFFPYGIEPNLKSINALLRYSHEQGLARQRLTIEDIFHPAGLELVEG